jgi:hypothetical protein
MILKPLPARLPKPAAQRSQAAMLGAAKFARKAHLSKLKLGTKYGYRWGPEIDLE